MSTKLTVPSVKEILKTGLQFGHNASRWNPKMSDYIYASKNNIHIVDVIQTRDLLEKAVNFLKATAGENNVLFVASKRQAADIVEEHAQRVGAFYIVNRWPGGLFTNFQMVKQSLNRLKDLEKSFEEGVEGRTKYEVTQMKNEWDRLNRLYRGVKEMEKLPSAIVVIDPGYERVAIREARLLDIPVVALADTNCDPDVVDYLIPGNDDALKSISMVVEVLADAVLTGNGGKGVKHNIKDYSEYNVELIKAAGDSEEETEEVAELADNKPTNEKTSARVKVSTGKKSKETAQKGILEK